jgi:indole-3-glycerol phosphate synthase
MMTILDNIIDKKKLEIKDLKARTSFRDLEKSALFKREVISLSRSLSESSKTGIIAEFKRKSPSKGIINSSSLPEVVAEGYIREGAAGVSILTDNYFFGGSNADLQRVREKGDFPILRKEFIIDEYQIIESKAIGADVILLIAAVLGNKELINLSRQARSAGMEVLMEIHEHQELDKVNEFVNIIGINNRNLKTFVVDTGISQIISSKIPAGYLKISESGISSPQVIKDLRNAGFNGFLIGEKFMSADDPVKSFSEFVKELI